MRTLAPFGPMDLAVSGLDGPGSDPDLGPQGPITHYDGGLILSGSIGRGHDSVAEACRVALGRFGMDARTLDCMGLLGGAGSRAGTTVFRRLISVPTVYDGFHFSHLRTGSRLARALDQAANRRLVPAVDAELGDGRQLVVSVFPTGVAAAGAIARRTRRTTAVAVCTDASAHRMWVAEGTELYVVCSHLAAATLRRYDPGAAISVVPPPVRPEIFGAPGRRPARAALGVPDDAPCVLLMAGGWGLGPLAEAADALAERGYWVLAVAGTNERLRQRLSAIAQRRRRVVAFGMTERVPELMAAADTVVTTPGQTCHEARVVGRWLVVLDAVPGPGRENALHELETGGALACSPDAESIASAVGVMFDEQPELAPWPVASAEEWEKHFIGALASVDAAPA
ncbi:MAG: glycosyl hydrolase [Acidimicrobiales bacterium]